MAEQINAIKVVSGKEVIAITLNHEGLKPEEIEPACKMITAETGLPCFDVLANGAEGLISVLKEKITK